MLNLPYFFLLHVILVLCCFSSHLPVQIVKCFVFARYLHVWLNDKIMDMNFNIVSPCFLDALSILYTTNRQDRIYSISFGHTCLLVMFGIRYCLLEMFYVMMSFLNFTWFPCQAKQWKFSHYFCWFHSFFLIIFPWTGMVQLYLHLFYNSLLSHSSSIFCFLFLIETYVGVFFHVYHVMLHKFLFFFLSGKQ